MDALFRVVATWRDGTETEDTVTNPVFETRESVEKAYREAFGSELVKIKVDAAP